jgi:hypothetical protein
MRAADCPSCNELENIGMIGRLALPVVAVAPGTAVEARPRREEDGVAASRAAVGGVNQAAE